MSRHLSADERRKAAKAKRDYALRRDELREASVPRASAASPTAMGVKVIDPDLRAMIDAAVAKKKESGT